MPEEFNLLFRTGEELLNFVNSHKDIEIDLISFDHDLGEDRFNGYDVVKELINSKIKVKEVQFHTDNIVGLENMKAYFISAKKHVDLYKDLKINKYKLTHKTF